MWISDDGESWREVWQAESPQAEWTVELPEGTECTFLKLGLPGKGTLHLNQVVVFGE